MTSGLSLNPTPEIVALAKAGGHGLNRMFIPTLQLEQPGPTMDPRFRGGDKG
jgi:hypothetical protein